MKVLGILGNNLRNLERTGQLSRFTDAYWTSYATRFDRIYIFSELPEGPVPSHDGRCIVVVPKSGIPMLFYQFLLPFLHKQLRNCQLIRVMHMTGTIPAIIAKFFWGIPFVATYGYDYSRFVWLSPRSRFILGLKVLYTQTVVRLGTMCSTKIIATAPHVIGKVQREKLVYLPNGVDTHAFSPNGSTDKPATLLQCIFVGRLEIQKNLNHLLDAFALLATVPYALTVVGDGSLMGDLQNYAEQKNIRAVFQGTVEHTRLPAILRQHHVFLLVSQQEGTPKALLEAMSCGLCCIGTDIPGTNSLIKQGKTGLLCDPSPESIAGAVRSMWENPSLRASIGRNARDYVCRHFDLATLLAKETELLYSIG